MQQQQQPIEVSMSGQPFVQPAGHVFSTQSNVVAKYYGRLSIGLGITLIVAALLSFAFNIVDLAIGYRQYQKPESVISTVPTTTTTTAGYSNGGSDWHYQYDDNQIYYYYYYPSYFTFGSVGHGFWVGVMCIITGGFGVWAGMRKTKCQIVSFNILCMISASAAAAQFGVGIAGAAINNNDYSCRYTDERHHPFQAYIYQQACERMPILVAMEAVLASLAVVEAVAAIWGSAVCCKAYCCCNCCYSCCCCCKTTQDYRMQQVIYNGIPMMVITPAQQSSMPVMYPVQVRPLLLPAKNVYNVSQPTQMEVLPPAYLAPNQPLDPGFQPVDLRGYINPLGIPTTVEGSVPTQANDQQSAKY